MPCRALEVTRHRGADRRAEGGRAALSRGSRSPSSATSCAQAASSATGSSPRSTKNSRITAMSAGRSRSPSRGSTYSAGNAAGWPRSDGRDASRRTTDRDDVEKSSSSGRQVTQQIVDGDAHRRPAHAIAGLEHGRGKAHPAARRGRELQYPRRLFTVAPPVARQASSDASASYGSSGATSPLHHRVPSEQPRHASPPRLADKVARVRHERTGIRTSAASTPGAITLGRRSSDEFRNAVGLRIVFIDFVHGLKSSNYSQSF
jgi:hypothetical protein